MRPETLPSFRRRNMRALAGLEFRVGLYWWLTRVLPSLPNGWLWVSISVAGLFGLPLLLTGDIAFSLHAPPAGPLVALLLGLPARVLLVAAVAGAWVLSESWALPPRWQLPPTGNVRRITGPSLAELLPLSWTQRAAATILGRLAALAPQVILGAGLLTISWLLAWSGGVVTPQLREAAIWGLLALLTAVARCMGRVSMSSQAGCSNVFLAYLLVRWVVTSHVREWTYPAWFALWWLVYAGLNVVGPASRAAVRAYERLRRRGATTDLDEGAPEPAVRWGLNWRHACTPEGGPRTWLRGMALVAAQVLALSAACVVVSPFASVHLGRMTALACFVLLPAFGGVLALAVATGGTLGDRSNAFRELLPLPHASRWRAQAMAGITGALVFAAMGEALGAGGLALTRAVTGAPVGAPAAMYWMPLTILAAALIAWAQEPLLRHAVDLVRDGEIILAVLVGVATLVLVPVVLAVALLGTPAWACPVVLWLTAGAVVLLSRATANPRTWDVRLDGYVTHNASQRANAVLLLSAASLGLLLACLLAAILAAA